MKKHQRIKRDNELYKNIRNIAPYYHVKVWEDQYQRQLDLQKYMRRVNLSKSTGKIVDTKIDSITQLTVSGDILTADEDEDNEDWLTNFLSTETSSSPGHVGNIRKVKAAHVKGSKTRPATAPVGEKRPLKSAVEVNNNTVLLPNQSQSPAPETLISISHQQPTVFVETNFPSNAVIKDDVIINISEHSSSGSQAAAASVPRRKKTMTASFSAKIDQVIILEEALPSDLINVEDVVGISWPTNTTNQRRKSIKPQQVEKVNLVAVQRFVRLVDLNVGSDLKSIVDDNFSCDGNESTHSTDVSNAGEYCIPAEITCWINREDEPTFVVAIVCFEEKEKNGLPKAAASRDTSIHSKRQILLETEAEINFRDLFNPGLLRLSKNNAHEINLMKELLEHVSRKEGALQSSDLEMLQRFAHDISSAVELVVHKHERFADARVLLNVAADLNIVSEFSSHHITGMRFDPTLLSGLIICYIIHTFIHTYIYTQ